MSPTPLAPLLGHWPCSDPTIEGLMLGLAGGVLGLPQVKAAFCSDWSPLLLSTNIKHVQYADTVLRNKQLPQEKGLWERKSLEEREEELGLEMGRLWPRRLGMGPRGPMASPTWSCACLYPTLGLLLPVGEGLVHSWLQHFPCHAHHCHGHPVPLPVRSQ
jgi:hypothetical protein